MKGANELAGKNLRPARLVISMVKNGKNLNGITNENLTQKRPEFKPFEHLVGIENLSVFIANHLAKVTSDGIESYLPTLKKLKNETDLKLNLSNKFYQNLVKNKFWNLISKTKHCLCSQINSTVCKFCHDKNLKLN